MKKWPGFVAAMWIGADLMAERMRGLISAATLVATQLACALTHIPPLLSCALI